MKELTIEQKAKRYDEALTKARNIVNSINVGLIGKDSFEAVFPELSEAEDEKIRKEIIDFVKSRGGFKGDWIAWLEKQSEQKPDIIIPKFRVGDTIRIKNSDAEYTITEISDGYYRGKGWCLDIAAGDECGDYELVEQKPWSEEDEKFFKTALWHISYSISNGKSTDFHCDTTDWFKSLKDRYTWKPSDEQIFALQGTLPVIKGCGTYQQSLLESLYEDLKKLREEDI